ncbi:MAG: hypothetical protein ACT4OU_07990 [Hyphomicrobium sp.]
MTSSKRDDVRCAVRGRDLAGGADAGADLPHRKTLGYTNFEQRALDLSRLIFDMHRNAAPPSWMAAMNLAESAEGPFEGPYVVSRVTTLIRALLVERNRPLSYMSAGSMYVSSDEADLMRVIRLARTGPFAELKSAAQTLAGRDHVCRILAAATALVQPDGMRQAAAQSSACFDDETAAAEPNPPMRLH